MDTTGLNRNTIDKYYTKTELAEYCILKFNTIIKPNSKDSIIEPSAGNGSFSNYLFNNYKNVVAIDIEPENDNIIKQDFLKYKWKDNICHVIGNPPFGRQSSLAKKFIKHSATFSESISFILPKSFKKESFKKVFPLEFHLIYEEDLPDNSFVVKDKLHDVPCVFQIWKKMSINREIEEKEEPTYYSFVKKTENPHLSFRRVGVYAGQISKEIENKSEQSHYFIKLNEINIDEFINKYNNVISYDFNNTVGPKSISKTELIKKLNRLF
jgi:hypothetical protein